MVPRTILLFCLICCSLPGAEKAVLWQQTSPSAQDLVNGSGGKEHEPAGPFKFLKEDLDGSNPKFDVQDSAGTKWKVKLGEETRSETAASRFVWAAGYSTYDNYFLPSIAVTGLPEKLKRGQELRSAGGVFANVRLKRSAKGEKKDGYWGWKKSQFQNTREWNGLRTLMAVINNWDLKDENNAVVRRDGVEVYLVSDLGASFGSDHLVKSQEYAKGNLEAYSKSRFIRHKTAQLVDFGSPGRPSFVVLINPHEYFSRVGLQWIGRKIPVEDARWMGQILGRLSPEQVRDAFRTSGFPLEQVEGFAKVVEDRIAELKAL